VILRTGAAAKLCGVSRFTLMRWEREDVRVHRCLFRKGWFIVERLAELGLCPMPQADGTPVVPLAEARQA
jgi:kynurenine formamidase